MVIAHYTKNALPFYNFTQYHIIVKTNRPTTTLSKHLNRSPDPIHAAAALCYIKFPMCSDLKLYYYSSE